MNMNKKKEIPKWIAEARKKGYSKAQIEEELKKHGYSTDIINKALEGNNKWGKNKTIITLAVLVVLILGVIGYFVFYRPSTAEYKSDKANALVEEGKIDEALKVYQEILTKYPDTRWEYLSNLHIGDIYFDKGDYESASPYFKEAIKLNPDKDCNSNNKLGRIYLEKKDYDIAIKFFLAALWINKNFKKNCSPQLIKSTDINLGRAYIKTGNYTQAIVYLSAAHKLGPDGYTNYFLGEAYYLNGEYDTAETYLNDYLKLNPTDKVSIETAQNYLKTIQENKKPA